MCGNGVMIGMMMDITKTAPKVILRVQIPVHIPFCVVVAGAIATTVVELRIVIETFAITATTSAVFVLPGLLNDYTLCF